MYMVIAQWRGDPARLEEAIALTYQDYFPRLQKAPGFLAYYFFMQDEKGLYYDIFHWQDKASADAFDALPRPQLKPYFEKIEQIDWHFVTAYRGDTILTVMPQP